MISQLIIERSEANTYGPATRVRALLRFMVPWYIGTYLRIAETINGRCQTLHCRAGADGRAHGKAPTESPQGLCRIPRPDARRFARRDRAARVRREVPIRARELETPPGIETLLRPRFGFARQSSFG